MRPIPSEILAFKCWHKAFTQISTPPNSNQGTVIVQRSDFNLRLFIKKVSTEISLYTWFLFYNYNFEFLFCIFYLQIRQSEVLGTTFIQILFIHRTSDHWSPAQCCLAERVFSESVLLSNHRKDTPTSAPGWISFSFLTLSMRKWGFFLAFFFFPPRKFIKRHTWR